MGRISGAGNELERTGLLGPKPMVISGREIVARQSGIKSNVASIVHGM